MIRRPPILALAFVLCSTPALFADDPVPTYERDIRPLLAKRCTVCHNARKLDDEDTSGGLALDSFEAVQKGKPGVTVVKPGQSAESEIYKRVCDTDEERRMPLYEKPLADEQRRLIGRWIDVGAPRGEPVATAAEPAPTRFRKVVRSLDVVVPIETRAPKDADGFGTGGPIELLVKLGPLPAVTALAFRGDGRMLAVGSHGEVVLWDLAEGRPAAILDDIPGPVHALAFTRDGRRLAVGAGEPASSGCVRLYTVPDGTLALDLEGHHDVVYGLALRPDGTQLASASFDQTVRLWSLIDGHPEGVLKGHSDFVYEVAYTPDGKALLSASKDRSIKRSDPKSRKGIRTYSDHNDDVLALAVKPDGSGFVTAGHEPQLRWWTLDGEKPARKVGGHSGPVHQLAFSLDGKRLISAGGDKSVRVWDGNSGIFQRTLPGPTEWQYAVALSADGHLAAAGGWDGIVRLWDADAGKLLATFLQPPSASPGQRDWLAIAPSGDFEASADLLPQLRWRVGGNECAAEAPTKRFHHPDRLARVLQGEAVPSPFDPPK